MIIFDKELQAELDQDDINIGKLFKSWDEANEALNLLIHERSSPRMRFYNKHELYVPFQNTKKREVKQNDKRF